MRKILKRKTFLKGLQSYRRLLLRRGHGIHSPFVYNLTTKVIAERCPFYCFGKIEQLRRQLMQDTTPLDMPSYTGYRNVKISNLVAREGIRPKAGALLFRLANHLKPENILQIGATMGISTLYLASYRAGVRCVSLENIAEYASVSRKVYEKSSIPVEHYIGEYENLLPSILQELKHVDFVFLNTWRDTSNYWLFNTCLEYKHDNTVFVFNGINKNKGMTLFWKHVCSHPDVTATLDLYTMGIVFFSNNLQKRSYRIYF